MESDKNGILPSGMAKRFSLYYVGFFIVHKAYPIIFRQGDFSSASPADLIAWVTNFSSVYICLLVALLIFATNIWCIPKLRPSWVFLSGIISSSAFTQFFYPIDFLNSIDDTAWGQPLTRTSVVSLLLIAFFLPSLFYCVPSLRLRK